MELCLIRFPEDIVHIFGFGRDAAGVLQLDAMSQVDAVHRVGRTKAFN
jgi:hypothetical protein